MLYDAWRANLVLCDHMEGVGWGGRFKTQGIHVYP